MNLDVQITCAVDILGHIVDAAPRAVFTLDDGELMYFDTDVLEHGCREIERAIRAVLAGSMNRAVLMRADIKPCKHRGRVSKAERAFFDWMDKVKAERGLK